MANIQSGATTDVLTIDPVSKAARVTLYDVSGSQTVVVSKYVVGPNQNYFPQAGLDGGQIVRPIRVGEHGTTRVTSEVALFHDAFEGSAISAYYTSGSNVTMTTTQTNGVMTINSAASTAANAIATIQSFKQFAKYPRQPLYCRFRAKLASTAAIHEFAELGFGSTVNIQPIVPNGVFFRMKTNGTLAGIVSYNGTEQEFVFTNVPNATNYYFYDIIIDDDFVRFLVSDSFGVPIVDQQVSITQTVPFTFSVSHVPIFARVYADPTGGGTAQQLLISALTVQMLDAANNVPWADQVSGLGRHSLNHPTSGTVNNSWLQTTQLNPGLVPATITPSATAGGNGFLGGEAVCTATGASENLLSVFSFGIPTPYTLFITDVNINPPINGGAVVATSTTVLEFALVTNCSSSNIQSGGGQRILIPNALFGAAVGSGLSSPFTGSMAPWSPRTPLMCLPGTYLHIAYKVIQGTATASETYRIGATIGGYWQ